MVCLRLVFLDTRLENAKFLEVFGFCVKQAARAWSPSVCKSQWVKVKNEFMAKVFLQKSREKVSAPTMGDGQNSENVI